MIRILQLTALSLALATTALAVDPTPDAATTAPASANPMVGGHEMFPTKNIVENAAQSEDHTTLVAAVKAAGLVKTLEGKGPFTVFAPTNEAFKALPEGTVETLLKPENKSKLTAILTYHVVAGDLTAAKLVAKIKAAKKGIATVKTVNGESLSLMLGEGGKGIVIKARGGDEATVTIADVKQSNGVIHVIDHVLLP